MESNVAHGVTRRKFFGVATSMTLASSLGRAAIAQPYGLKNYTTGTRGIICVCKISGRIAFLDPTTYAVLDEFAVDRSPHELVLAPDMRRAYVSIYGTGVFGNIIKANHRIAIIDLASRSLEGYIDVAPLEAPHGLMFDRSGLLWVTCEASARVAVIDVARRNVLASIATGTTGSHFMTLLADGKRLFVSNKSTRYVSVIDVASREVIHRIPDSEGTDGLCTSIDGRYVFVNDFEKPILYVVDARRMSIERAVPLRGQSGHAARVRVSLDGRYVVTSNYLKSVVTIMPMHDLTSQRTIDVEKGPMGFAFPRVPDRALVANHDAGTLTALNLASGEVLGTYRVPMGPESISYY